MTAIGRRDSVAIEAAIKLTETAAAMRARRGDNTLNVAVEDSARVTALEAKVAALLEAIETGAART